MASVTFSSDSLPTPPSERDIEEAKMALTADANGVPSMKRTERKHIWLITGPAGCGKTSVAEYLHEKMSFPYLEGDTVGGAFICSLCKVCSAETPLVSYT